VSNEKIGYYRGMNTPEISQQDRINAAAAYMLLGWIFLLAKNNPIYQHPYVVQHSKKASKLLLTQALILCIAGFGIAPRINYSIPFISEISYGNVLLFFTFSWAMFHTLHSAFRAYDGKEVGTDEIAQKNTTEQLQDFH
jgi:hypothetical protein